MTDTDIENIYKSAVNVSHFAGLRAVYDAGYDQGASINPVQIAGDASATQAAPVADVPIQSP